jgi:hypothetical protein
MKAFSTSLTIVRKILEKDGGRFPVFGTKRWQWLGVERVQVKFIQTPE